MKTIKQIMTNISFLYEFKKDINAECLNLEKLTDNARILRNLCATNESAHNALGNDILLLQDVCKFMERLMAMPSSEETIVCLRLCTQFVCNLAVGNAVNQKNIQSYCFETIKKLISIGDEKLSHLCCMLIYNILLGHPEVHQDILEDPNIIKEILNEKSEFASFLYEELINIHGKFVKLYESANDNQRLILLSTIKENANNEVNVNNECIKFIIERFKRQSDKILKIVSEYVEDLNPLEICLMLEALATLSSNHQYLNILQSDKSLFINCAFLLKSVHETGKSGNNCFTSVQRLTAGMPDDNIKQHPAYAFKVDLIRILGNLCWKQKELQDEMRELDCIPVLLECCNIDEKNPFITQWSVLAIRNLCENNKENQSYIAGLSQKGVVSNPILTELGYTLHTEGEKNIKLVPLQR